jgi:23S rRNA (adenine2503-C2)-methyltransferase
MINLTARNEWVNSVIYPPTDNAEEKINLAISPLLGCPIACKFCINWRHKHDAYGKETNFLRQLTTEEIVAQVYLAMINSRIRNSMEPRSNQNLVVNFAVEGDVAFNIDNSCAAIKQLLNVFKPKISFILTSVGTEASLKRFIEKYIRLPRIKHHWSVNSLNPDTRHWLMPGTAEEDLRVLRDLYQAIATVTDTRITVSWIVINGVNNQEEDAVQLAKFFNDRPFEIKLMALVKNSLEGVKNTSNRDVEMFHRKLIKAGLNIPIRIRKIHGSNIFSGCGNTITTWANK